MSVRQIVLDTETTGLYPKEGHRITEIGCVEIIDRKITGNNFQTYINPERELDEDAARITGLTYEFLQDKPLFADIIDHFLDFIKDSQLIIHNAPFDLGFLNHEINLAKHKYKTIEANNYVLDTLLMAKRLHPGAKNNLDALCNRYKVDNTHREYHGALLDSEILARVYLAMTAGQTKLALDENDTQDDNIISTSESFAKKINRDPDVVLRVIKANSRELVEHQQLLELIEKKSG